MSGNSRKSLRLDPIHTTGLKGGSSVMPDQYSDFTISCQESLYAASRIGSFAQHQAPGARRQFCQKHCVITRRSTLPTKSSREASGFVPSWERRRNSATSFGLKSNLLEQPLRLRCSRALLQSQTAARELL